MEKPVSIKQVVAELEALMEGWTAYISKETGELLTVTEEDRFTIESGSEDDEMEGPDAEQLDKLREVVESEQWIALPDKFDIHEWEIMRAFAESRRDPELAEQLLRAIRGRGAFRYFRDLVYEHGLEKQWFEYKREAIEEIARNALEVAGIPYA